MTETSVTENTCNDCGVEVRVGSQFCYNCGSSVSLLPAEGDVSYSDGGKNDDDSLRNGTKHDGAEEKSPKSAKDRGPSTVRRRNVRKPIVPREVSWVEPEGLGLRFLLTTIVLAILTITLVALAFYLR